MEIAKKLTAVLSLSAMLGLFLISAYLPYAEAPAEPAKVEAPAGAPARRGSEERRSRGSAGTVYPRIDGTDRRGESSDGHDVDA